MYFWPGSVIKEIKVEFVGSDVDSAYCMGDEVGGDIDYLFGWVFDACFLDQVKSIFHNCFDNGDGFHSFFCEGIFYFGWYTCIQGAGYEC